jgi:hypothetical protein
MHHTRPTARMLRCAPSTAPPAAPRLPHSYLADSGNCRVLRVRLDSGEAVVHAGSGYGHRDGHGRRAKFACPLYLALDPRDGS